MIEDAGIDDLDGDAASHDGLLGLVDDAHAAAAQLTHEAIFAVVGQVRRQTLRRRGGHLRGLARPRWERRNARLGGAELADEGIGGRFLDGLAAGGARLQVAGDRGCGGVGQLPSAKAVNSCGVG